MKKHTIIYRFIGERKDRVSIKQWINIEWKNECIVKFMPKNFFKMIFTTEDEKERILLGWIWKMKGDPLYLEKWFPNFNPLDFHPYDSPVWVQLYNLLIEYWCEESLEKMGRLLGTLLEIDANLVTGDLYIYARLKLVEVGVLTKTIKLCAMRKKLI
ncbi:hypothetical protein SUGI_0765770 [Cryptomeria japonica]|nr:hypothetical protein SUGI_0765770 [Cryptomeria japonica]